MSDYIKREDVENLKNKNVPSAYDGEDWTDEKSRTDPIFAYQFGWNTALEAVKRWKNGLRSIPSADVVPARHGRWIEYGENKDGTHNMICSKCGAGLKSKGHANSYYTKHKYRYCNNCGAKMDLED